MSDDEILVERARVALRRLADAPAAADVARAALAELDAAWQTRPFVIGLVGEDIFARTDLVESLSGGGLFELEGRIPGCAAVSIRRGDATRFRAIARDGSEEAMTLPPPAPPSPVAARRTHVETMRAAVAEREATAARLELTVPHMVRVPPPWWAIWIWLVRWIVVWIARNRTDAWQRACNVVAYSRRELAAAEDEVPTDMVSPDPRQRFHERLRVLASGMLAGRDTVAIELDVNCGPLPEDVLVVELAGTKRTVDLTLAVTRAGVEVVGTGRQLGTPVEAAAILGHLPGELRALRLGRRAREVLFAQVAALQDLVERAEVDLRNRLGRLELLRLPDPGAFITAQIDRVQSQLGSSVHAVLEHAGVHLGSELAQAAAEWEALVTHVSTGDALKAAAAQIDEQAPAAAKRIAEEVAILVIGGVGGSAHDLLPTLFEPLRQHGLPDEHAQPPRGVPPLPPVAMLPSLANPSPSNFAGELTGAGPWLTGLFRSLDSKRTELLEHVRQRASHVRAVASAELLDAEPRLRGALREAITNALAAAVARRVTWLEAELAKEEAAVADERARLRPLAKLCDDVRQDARRLSELLAAREAPATSATGS